MLLLEASILGVPLRVEWYTGTLPLIDSFTAIQLDTLLMGDNLMITANGDELTHLRHLLAPRLPIPNIPEVSWHGDFAKMILFNTGV